MTVFASAIALALAATLGPQSAAEAPASTTIQIDRASLTDPKAARAALDSIRAASLEVCRQENAHGAMAERSIRICAEDTLKRTVTALDAPALTAAYQGQPDDKKLARAGEAASR